MHHRKKPLSRRLQRNAGILIDLRSMVEGVAPATPRTPEIAVVANSRRQGTAALHVRGSVCGLCQVPPRFNRYVE